MKASLTFRSAVIAVAALAISSTASAYDNGYVNQHQQSNGGNQVLGALIGGVAGAALGDGIAGRGQSTEFGIAGGILGGIAGAAIAGGNSHGYNNGYYNSQTGYYGGGYSQQPRVSYGYQQPYYPAATYRTTTYVQTPTYYAPPRYYSTPYYGRPRTTLSINIGNGGLFGNNRYRSNRYYTTPVRYVSPRRIDRRRDRRRDGNK